VYATPGAAEGFSANSFLCGDINIAHQQIDLKNWKEQSKELWLSARRTCLDDAAARARRAWWMCTANCTRTPRTIATLGGAIVDKLTPRTLAGGWTTTWPPLLWPPRQCKVAIYKDEKFSDHAPVTVDYDFSP
jgi:exodeoxyribonuclease-3